MKKATEYFWILQIDLKSLYSLKYKNMVQDNYIFITVTNYLIQHLEVEW